GLNRQQVRAESLDLALDGGGRAAADGDEDDHRSHADRDPEQGQEGAQPVGEHTVHRHPRRFEQAHTAASSGAFSADACRVSATMWPSATWITRFAFAATSASCVIV